MCRHQVPARTLANPVARQVLEYPFVLRSRPRHQASRARPSAARLPIVFIASFTSRSSSRSSRSPVFTSAPAPSALGAAPLAAAPAAAAADAAGPLPLKVPLEGASSGMSGSQSSPEEPPPRSCEDRFSITRSTGVLG